MQEESNTNDTPLKLGFPSSKRAVQTHAPMYAAFLVGGIVIGALAATYGLPESQGSASGAATSTAQQAGTSTNAADAAVATPTEPPLAVNDQPAGPSVAISRLALAEPTWIVVYLSRDGSPGNALGAKLFFPSDRQGTVGLLRSTQPGQSYFVGLSIDNGDRVFSLSKDKPFAGADGGPLWATFRAR